MVTIEDLEKGITKDNDKEAFRAEPRAEGLAPEKTAFKNRKLNGAATKAEENETREEWKKLEREERSRIRVSITKLIRWIAVLGTLVLLGIGAYYYVSEYVKFFSGDIVVKFVAPSSVRAGDFRKIDIIYQNRGRTNLEDAKISVRLPELADVKASGDVVFAKDGPFYRFDVGNVLGKKDGRISFDARFWGEEGSSQGVEAELSYRPENGNSYFSAKEQFSIDIKGSVFTLRLSSAPHAVNDKETDIFVEYGNDGGTVLEDVRIVAEYPEGFSYQYSDVNPSQADNVWDIGALQAGEVGKIQIRGVASGFDGEIKEFSAYLSSERDASTIKYSKAKTTLIISSAILSVYQTANESRNYMASFNEGLVFKIRYKNMTDVAVAGVTIEAELDSDAVDLESLSVEDGAYDYRRNKIVWNSQGVPNLRVLGPRQDGTVTFKVQTRRLAQMSINSPQQREFTIVGKANISGSAPAALSGVPISVEDEVEVRLGTAVNLYTKGYYYEGPFRGALRNEGPIPPRVGQKTIYTIVWSAVNAVNDAHDVDIFARLPQHMEWVGATAPFGEVITYDATTGIITWHIDKLNAGTGYYLRVREAAFQVAITPPPHFVGKAPEMLYATELTGMDLFTGKSLKAGTERILTDISFFDTQTVRQDGVITY